MPPAPHPSDVATPAWRNGDEVVLTPILGAALELFQAKGYHGTPVREIANSAGLTMPALYYHHGNKEGILLALLDIAMDQAAARLDAALEEAGEDTHQQFVNFVTAIALHTTCLRDLASLHTEFRFLGPECRESYVRRRDETYLRLVGLIDRGISEGLFTPQDSRFTARALLGMLLAITEWYRPGGPQTPEDIASRYVERGLRLLGATTVMESSAPGRRRTGRGSR